MGYKISYHKNAKRSLNKMDFQQKKRIIKWIDDNLAGIENPRIKGKALQGDLAGLWRYRVGNYRIIAKILDKEVVIQIVESEHRSKAYDKIKKLNL